MPPPHRPRRRQCQRPALRATRSARSSTVGRSQRARIDVRHRGYPNIIGAWKRAQRRPCRVPRWHPRPWFAVRRFRGRLRARYRVELLDERQSTAKIGPTTTPLKAAVRRRYRPESVARALDLVAYFDCLTTSIVSSSPCLRDARSPAPSRDCGIYDRGSAFLRPLNALTAWNVSGKLAVCNPVDHCGQMRMQGVLLTWLPSRLDDAKVLVFMDQLVDIRECRVCRRRFFS